MGGTVYRLDDREVLRSRTARDRLCFFLPLMKSAGANLLLERRIGATLA
jgi:hypothetical protein